MPSVNCTSRVASFYPRRLPCCRLSLVETRTCMGRSETEVTRASAAYRVVTLCHTRTSPCAHSLARTQRMREGFLVACVHVKLAYR